MISQMMGPKNRAEVERLLDSLKGSVLAAVDRGESVTLHTHNESKPADDHTRFGAAQDFLHTGWTFGVSIGDYPRKPVGDFGPSALKPVYSEWSRNNLDRPTVPCTDAEIAEFRRWQAEQRTKAGPDTTYAGNKVAVDAAFGERQPEPLTLVTDSPARLLPDHAYVNPATCELRVAPPGLEWMVGLKMRQRPDGKWEPADTVEYERRKAESLDVQVARAIGVPAELLQASGFGAAYSGARVALDTFVGSRGVEKVEYTVADAPVEAPAR